MQRTVVDPEGEKCALLKMCEGMVEAAPEPNPPLLPLLPVFIYIQHFMQNVGVGVEMFFFFFFFHPQSEWVWLKKKTHPNQLEI